MLIAFAPLTNITYWGIDVYTFRAGAKAIAIGENPYYESNILRFADGATVGNIHNFAYAPFFGFLLRPLVWFEPVPASRLWFALNLIFYFASISLIIKAINWQPTLNAFLLAMIGLILYPPLRTTLVIGQNTLFLLFWLSLSYYLVKRSYPILGGVSLSLALFKPHLAPLLPFYVVKRQWKFLGGFVLGAVITTLPFLTYLDDWINSGTLAYTLNTGNGGCFRLVSVTAMIQCFIPSGWSQIIIISLLIVFTLSLSLPYFWQNRSPQDPLFDHHVALIIVIILLLLDNVRIADQMLLVLPILVIWRDWHFIKTGWMRRLAVALIMTVYVIPYAVDFLQSYNIAFILPLWYLGLSLAILGLLLLQARKGAVV
ncbi:glycosyltransferase family 87 protein [Chloroflexota bacterium]